MASAFYRTLAGEGACVPGDQTPHFVHYVTETGAAKFDNPPTINVKCLEIRAFCFFCFFIRGGMAIAINFADAASRTGEDGGQFMSRFAAIATFTVSSFLIFANSYALFGQPDSIYRLPAGTRIRLKLDAEINSKVSSVNDTFIATVAQPVMIRDTVVLPVGTTIEGRVSNVTQAATGQGGTLDVVFETLKISNETRRIDGTMITQIMAESSRTFNVLSILGGLAVGAAIGGASNSSSGALIGAAVGAGAGTGIAFLRKGKDVRIRKGEEFEIELKKEVLLPVLDY